VLLPTSPGIAAHKKVPCKQIKEAVAAGKTLDQITAEFQVDQQQVFKCTQGKSRHRKPSTGSAKPKHAATGSQAASGAPKPPSSSRSAP